MAEQADVVIAGARCAGAVAAATLARQGLRVLTGGPGGVRRVLDVYSRLRDPRETLALPGLLRATVRALAHGAGARPAILRSATEAAAGAGRQPPRGPAADPPLIPGP